MKYYVTEVSTGDAKIAGKSVYEYDNEVDAVASFHKKLGTAMGSELYTEELIEVLRGGGLVMKVEHFVR